MLPPGVVQYTMCMTICPGHSIFHRKHTFIYTPIPSCHLLTESQGEPRHLVFQISLRNLILKLFSKLIVENIDMISIMKPRLV